MNSFLKKELEFSIRLSKEAGKIIMKHAHSKVKISEKKGKGNFVTHADKEADDHIIAQLEVFFPNDGILTEESKDDYSRLKKERVWIIDPLDGTSNFKEFALSDGKAKEYQYFAVQIGLVIKNEAVLGVLYVPTLDELYYAIKGQGAYKVSGSSKHKKLKVRKVKLSKSSVILSKGAQNNLRIQHITRNRLHQSHLFHRVFGYRIMAIADKKIDGYVYYSHKYHAAEWDLCAPQIILEEAGGIVTDFQGKKFLHNKKDHWITKGIIAQSRKGIVPFL